jgi:tRNA(Arg) A34 adenosine deaminase TadA
MSPLGGAPLHHDYFMREALREAEAAGARGEVPVGAVVVSVEGMIIGRGGNTLMAGYDPTAHGEINALRDACQRQSRHRLDGASLYVTLEPCAMCGHAMGLARIGSLYFGAFDPKGGGILQGGRVLDHSIHKVSAQGGILAEPCGQLLKDFFQQRRAKRGEGG